MKSYLNIKLSKLNVDEQFNHLKSFNILPLQLRFFQNVVLFIFSLIKSNRESYMLRKINECKKGRVTRSNFAEPKFKTVLYQYSFLSISVRLLNSFIFKHLSDNEKTFRSAFQSSILLLFNGNKKFWNKD